MKLWEKIKEIFKLWYEHAIEDDSDEVTIRIKKVDFERIKELLEKSKALRIKHEEMKKL